MGFLARVHDRRTWTGPVTNWTDEKIISLFGRGAKTTAGIVVTEENAFTFSAVYDAVNQLSSDIAKLPLNLMKRLEGGGSEPYTSLKLYRILKDAPNEEMTSFVFRRTFMAHALTCKGAFAEIERSPGGGVAALYLLEPHRVTPKRDGNGPLYYEVTSGTAPVQKLPARDVLHIHGLGYNGYCAYPLIALARQAIGLALAAEAFGASFFGNGLQYGGILTSDQPWDEEEAKNAKTVLESMVGGPEAAHQLVALWGGMKLEKTGMEPEKAQMDALRDKQVQEVARFFRIPLHRMKLAIPGAVSYSSVEMADLDYYKGPILDWTTNIEQEFARKLISPLEAKTQFIKHNVNAFLRGDIKSRYDALGIARDKGIINADEWRELEDWNPQPGGQGKLYLVQSAQVPINLLEALTQSQIDKNKQPPPAPNAPAPTPDDEPLRKAIAMLELRIERADQMVEEARNAERSEREAREVAEQGATLTEAELAALRARESQAAISAGQFEVIRSTLASELAQAREQLTTAVESRAEMAHLQAITATERDAAKMDLQRAVEDLDASTANVNAALGEAATAKQAALEAAERAETAVEDKAALQARADELSAAAEHMAVLVTEANDARDALVARVEAAETALKEATQAAADAEARAAKLEADSQARLDAVSAELATAQADALVAGEAVTEAERRLNEERKARESAEAIAVAASKAETRTAAEATATIDTTRAELEAARTSEQAAVEASVIARQVADMAAAERTTLREEADMLRQQIADRDRNDAAVLTAHRALIADVMRRMVGRECERLRRAQASPSKLRTAIGLFYDDHRDLCVSALLPAVRAHLVWLGVTDDPAQVAEMLVDAYLSASQRDLDAVLATDPVESFGAALEKRLQQWERDRPDAIADQVLSEALARKMRRES